MNYPQYFLEDYRAYIKNAFQARRERNPSYSHRAFARDMGIGVSTLTEILQGKYGLSKQRIKQVVTALRLSAEETAHFSDLVRMKYARSEEERDAAKLRVRTRINFNSQSLTMDAFIIISEWYYFALLELISLAEFQNNLNWISRRLAITEDAAAEAIERLIRLGLVKRIKQALLVTEDFSAIGEEKSSEAVRKFHYQILQKAITSLESHPVQQREVSSTIFSINTSDLPKAKKKLLNFRREFGTFLSKAECKNDVFCLGVQFFSLLKSEV